MLIMLLTIILFFSGGSVASFAMCVGCRFSLDLNYNNRSYCDNCHTTLSWWQLIPIGGYLLQQGRCIHCHGKISFWSPILECLCGILFCWSFYHTYSFITFGFHLTLFTWLLILACQDFYSQTVSRILLFTGVLIFLILNFLLSSHPTIPHLFFWGSFSCFLLCLSFLQTFGWADTIILCLLGLIFEPQTFIILLITATLSATCFSIIAKRKIIPFIPSILHGLIVIIVLNLN